MPERIGRVTTIGALCPSTACSDTATLCFRAFGPLLAPFFWRFKSNGECGLWLCAGRRKGLYGCQSVGVAVIPCALVFSGVCWPGHFLVDKNVAGNRRRLAGNRRRLAGNHLDIWVASD